MMKPISPIYINVKGRLLDLATPQVMGILNVTPDSFSDGGRWNHMDDAFNLSGIYSNMHWTNEK